MDAGITPADVERESLRDVPLERIVARAESRPAPAAGLAASGARESRRGFAGRPGRAARQRPRPRPAARRGARHRAPARRRQRRVAGGAAAHRPHGRRPGQRAARAGAADGLRRVRGPAAPVPDDLTGRPAATPASSAAAPPVLARRDRRAGRRREAAAPAVLAARRWSSRWWSSPPASALGAAWYRFERSALHPAARGRADGGRLERHRPPPARVQRPRPERRPRCSGRTAPPSSTSTSPRATCASSAPARGCAPRGTRRWASGTRCGSRRSARRASPSRPSPTTRESGRRWTLAEVGSVRSYPAISGDVAVWCSAPTIGAPTINGVRVGSGEAFEVAAGGRRAGRLRRPRRLGDRLDGALRGRRSGHRHDLAGRPPHSRAPG